MPGQKRAQSAYHLAGTDVVAADVGQDLTKYVVSALARLDEQIGGVHVARIAPSG